MNYPQSIGGADASMKAAAAQGYSAGVIGGGNLTERPRSEIEASAEQLHHVLSELEHRVDLLGNRLGPILRPMPAENAKDRAHAPGVMSPIAEQFVSAANRVGNLLRTVNLLHETLAL